MLFPLEYFIFCWNFFLMQLKNAHLSPLSEFISSQMISWFSEWLANTKPSLSFWSYSEVMAVLAVRGSHEFHLPQSQTEPSSMSKGIQQTLNHYSKGREMGEKSVFVWASFERPLSSNIPNCRFLPNKHANTPNAHSFVHSFTHSRLQTLSKHTHTCPNN